MYLKELTLKDFGPFKDVQTIKFNASAVVFIKGIYTDNPDQSNRAGKTSFVEAILYLLFGQTRDKEVKLIHNGASDMYVQGKIDVDGQEIFIKRGRTLENKPILEIEGIKGSKKDKEKELVSLIGLSYPDFIQTNYFQQGNLHTFMQVPPSEKKKLLISWFNLDKWTVYQDKAKVKATLYNAELQKLEASKKANEEFLTQQVINHDEDQIKIEIAQKQIELKASKDLTYRLQAELDKTENPKEIAEQLLDLGVEISNYSNQISSTMASCNRFESAKKVSLDNQAKVLDLKSTIKFPSLEVLEFLNAENTRLSLLKVNIGNLTLKLNETKTLQQSLCSFSGVCPIDKKECDKGTRIPDYKLSVDKDLEDIKTQIDEMHKSYKDLQDKVNNISLDYNRTKKAEDLIGTYSKESDPTSYDSVLQELNTTLSLSTSKKKELEANLFVLTEKFKNYDQNKREEIKAQIALQAFSQSGLSHRIDELNNLLGKIEQVKNSRISLTQKINDLSTEITTKKKEYYGWQYLVSILGKDGIPSILIENCLCYIEDFTNMLLESVSKGFSIEFSTTREVTTKETHCSICGSLFGADNKCNSCPYGFKKNKVKDEIDLKIFNNGIERSFELDSGGGQVLISLSLRLALAKLLSNRSKKCEILVLDEIFGSLDAVNRDLVAKLVFNNVKDLLSIRQIYCISHTCINDYPYQTISIIRDQNQNFSKISLD